MVDTKENQLGVKGSIKQYPHFLGVWIGVCKLVGKFVEILTVGLFHYVLTPVQQKHATVRLKWCFSC